MSVCKALIFHHPLSTTPKPRNPVILRSSNPKSLKIISATPSFGRRLWLFFSLPISSTLLLFPCTYGPSSSSAAPSFDPVSPAEKDASDTLTRRVSEAIELLEKGREFQAQGDFNRALEFFSQGIIKVIRDIFPYATQRYCARHDYSNFKTVHKGVLLKNLFWTVARAYHVFDFEDAMERIKNASPEAYDWLKEIPPSTWSRHSFDVRVKNDHITNNLTESFNQWVGEHREKSIISLVDGIRSRWMVKIQKRYQTALKWTTLVTPKVCGILDARIKASRNCCVFFAGQDEYEVKEDKTSGYIVKLGPRTCTCKVWDLSGIPCKHAVQRIRWRREDLENYYNQCYRVDTYLRAYVEMIHPIPDQKMWPIVDMEPLMPPSLHRLTGRPKKNRRKADEPHAAGEVHRSSTLRCCIYKQFGHNKRTCQRGPTRGSNKASGSRRKENS